MTVSASFGRPVEPGRAPVREVEIAAQNQYLQVESCFGLIDSIAQDEDHAPKLAASFAEHLTKEQRADFNGLLREMAESMVREFTASDTHEIVTIRAEDHDPEAFATFQRVLVHTGMRISAPKRSHLIQQSVLILLVIGFETLMSDLATIAIRQNPGAANLENHTLTLAELQALGTVEEARDFLISGYVEDLARGSIEGWVKWFAKVGVQLDEIPEDWLQFREVFARRNLLVHTDGRVSKQYVDTLVDAGAKLDALPGKGMSVEVTREYLRQSCELLMAVGALLTTSLSMKINPKDPDHTVRWSLSTAERALEDGHFHAGLQICRKIRSVSKNKASLVTDCRLKQLEWTALAMMGDEDRVASEAANWDIRGVDPLYSHIRAVFMREDDEALRAVAALVEASRLSKFEVLRSPTYHGLRERVGASLRKAIGLGSPTSTSDSDLTVSVVAVGPGPEPETVALTMPVEADSDDPLGHAQGRSAVHPTVGNTEQEDTRS